MANKVKVPGGAFYAGDGLTVDQTTRTVSAGGGSSVSTPDWNQNDATASDYIKNRPGGYTKTTPGYEITWDGVVGDKVVVGQGGIWSVKVSDRVFTVEELIGATIIKGGQSFTINNDDIQSQNGVIIVGYGVLVCTTPTTIGNIAIPEVGTYFTKTGEVFVSSLSKPDSTITVKIPAEYLELAETNEAISAAMSAASIAQSAASMAQTTADTAKTTADTAQSTANAAQSTANAAKTTADTAKTTADNAVHRTIIGNYNNRAYYDLGPGATDDSIRSVAANIGWSGGSGLRIEVKDETNPSVTFTPPVYVNHQADFAFARASDTYPHPKITEIGGIVMYSSTSGSTKKFRITVDDNGAISATEITEQEV